MLNIKTEFFFHIKREFNLSFWREKKD